MQDGTVFFEASAEAAANRERELIEEKMNMWVKAIDAFNAECGAFSHYYFNNDRSENFIKKREADGEAQDGGKELYA